MGVGRPADEAFGRDGGMVEGFGSAGCVCGEVCAGKDGSSRRTPRCRLGKKVGRQDRIGVDGGIRLRSCTKSFRYARRDLWEDGGESGSSVGPNDAGFFAESSESNG